MWIVPERKPMSLHVRRVRQLVISALFATVCLASTTQAQEISEKGFQSPPVSAKPQTWWHWMNGNISQEGITADLEAMKRIGLGGAEIFNVDVGFPDGKAPMMSPQWSAAIQHAIKEGHRLGLKICIHNGGGWSSSGGPWIKPEQGMQFLTWSETPFHGPGRFEGILPQPPKRENFYRDIAVYAVRKPVAEDSGTPLRIANVRVKAAFERGDHLAPADTATPEGAATPKKDVILLAVSSGASPSPADLARESRERGSGGEGKFSADGRLTWDAPEGDWILMRVGYTPTGETNHPAPASGRGLECDKLSREALDTHWAGMMGPIVQEAGPLAGKTLDDCLIDSYEVGTQNWSPKFREEFRARRGYDPLPYLPVVSGRVIGSVEESERFLWDLRRTICDLFADNYYGYLADVCHKHGLIFSTEPYGNGEFDNLQIGGVADIPMGEFWVGNGAIETTKLASSAGHIYGHPVIGAESFTADTPHARWTIDPYAMKVLGDRVFSLGVNRYIFHRYAHQPWMDLKPGMTMGPWGTNFERTITWWDQGAEWIRYITRCQYLLQSGKFVADVAYFEGDDGPNDLPMLKGDLLPESYDYDGVDAVSLKKMTVQNGWIVLPSGMRYRLLVLNDSAWMTPETARKIRDLVQAGATVYGPKPRKSPSLQGYPACDTEVERIAEEVWGPVDGTTVTEHAYGKGRVLWGKPLKELLPAQGIAPDCELIDANPRWMAWIHRTTPDADLYFVSNQRYQPQNFTVAFRVTGKTPELWNPQTGKTAPAPIWHEENGRTYVPLSLTAAESVFVVFRHAATPDHLVRVAHLSGGVAPAAPPQIEIEQARYEAIDGAGGADVTAKVAALVKAGETAIEASNAVFGDPINLHVKRLRVIYRVDGKRMEKIAAENEELDLIGDGSDTAAPDYEVATTHNGIELRAWTGGLYELTQADGKTQRITPQAAQTVPISGTWSVRFPPDLGAPAQIRLTKLISWPDSSDPGVKYFSGSADYRITFDAPRSLFGKDRVLYLDLGTVKNFAEIWLNGIRYDTLWKPPFRLDVTDHLHPGQNTLRVRVTNLWPNRIIGDEQYPPDVEWNGEVIKAWPQWLLEGKPRPKGPRITFTTWRVFQKDSPLYPSGLIGPATLISVPRISLLSEVTR